MRLEYKKLHGSFYLYDMDQAPSKLSGTRSIRLMSDRIALLYDPLDGILMKHGAPDMVYRTYDRMKAVNGDLIVVVSDKWDVVELNKMLSISGYARCFHENTFGIDRPERIADEEDVVPDNIMEMQL